jgi:hypothetical protein
LPQSLLFCDFYSIVNLFLQKAESGKRDDCQAIIALSALTALCAIEPVSARHGKSKLFLYASLLAVFTFQFSTLKE